MLEIPIHMFVILFYNSETYLTTISLQHCFLTIKVTLMCLMTYITRVTVSGHFFLLYVVKPQVKQS